MEGTLVESVLVDRESPGDVTGVGVEKSIGRRRRCGSGSGSGRRRRRRRFIASSQSELPAGVPERATDSSGPVILLLKLNRSLALALGHLSAAPLFSRTGESVVRGGG